MEARPPALETCQVLASGSPAKFPFSLFDSEVSSTSPLLLADVLETSKLGQETGWRSKRSRQDLDGFYYGDHTLGS